MQTLGQKYLIRKILRMMEKSSVIATEEKEILKFGEGNFKTWVKEQGWVFYPVRIKSLDQQKEEISRAYVAENWYELILAMRNDIIKLQVSRAQDDYLERARQDVLRQYGVQYNQLRTEHLSHELTQKHISANFKKIA